MSRRRLLMTADAVGGVWQYSLDLAAALAAHGIDVTLALLGPAPSADQRRQLDAAGIASIECGLPLDWLCDGPAPVLAAGARLADLVREGGYDLVQLNMPTLAAGGSFDVPVIAVAHGCLATWWEAAHGTPVPDSYRWLRDLTETGLRAADLVVAPTHAYAGIVRHEYDLPVPPAAVHNGRRPLGTDRAAAHDCAFTSGRLWDRVKNVRLLDRVAGRLHIPFYAAGAAQGPHGERIELAHLRALGHVEEERLARELARRPVFVSAATFEPFGLAVLEAAAAGCPLILSDIATFRELWDGAAAFVDPRDEDGFVAAIDAVIGDDGLRQRRGQAARDRAARYTPAAMAAAMADHYARVAPARRAAA